MDGDYNSFKNQLMEFAEVYFPNNFNDFSEGNPGMMFLEMASHVGDVLSFYTETQLKESFLTTAQEKENLYNLAYAMGYKPKVTSAASVDLDIFQLVPSKLTNGSYIPDYNYGQVGEVGNPITIIRNGQSENTDEKGWVPLIEDSNNDSSIIYMTSNQQITGFTPASLNQQSFGADIEEQKTLEQQLTDISPPAVIEPEVEEEVEVDETAFGSGGSEDDPVISTPQTSSLTGSQEIEDELTPFDEFAGDDEDLYYYEVVLSEQNIGASQ